MMQFTTRAYNTLQYNPKNQTVLKTSQEPRLLDEVGFYQNVPGSLQNFFPRLFSSGTSLAGEHFAQLEWYAYNDLAKGMVNSEFSEVYWKDAAKCIHNALIQFGECEDGMVPSSHLKEMYEVKTFREYQNLLNQSQEFHLLSNFEKLTINGIEYSNFKVIQGRILDLIQNWLMVPVPRRMTHGDMSFGNILFGGQKTVKFIDPRGSWGSRGIYGDPRYDIAKLYHSFHGKYEYITNDKFDLREDGQKFALTYSNDIGDQIGEIFLKELSPFFGVNSDLEYRLIEGLIFIGMCARHYDSQNRQKAMYLTGVKILNEVLWQI